MSGPIKLRAVDAEDLRVVSACLQDGIVPIGELCFLPEESHFLMVVNRFKWEEAAPGGVLRPGPYSRTLCALCITGVSQVRRRNVDLLDRGRVLNLLTILPEDEGLQLIFAGDSAIHLVAAGWRCLIQDLGDPWPTAALPRHPEGAHK